MEDKRSYWDRALRRRLSRRNLLRAGAVTGLGLAAGLPALGCSTDQTQSSQAKPGQTPEAAKPKYGGTLRIGYGAMPSYLSPTEARGGNDPDIMLLYCDELVYENLDGTSNPDLSLATSYKREDDTTFLFNLRQGVKFHDGTDYDADAQKAYLEYILDPSKAKNFSGRPRIEAIKSIEVVDKYTLRLRLSQTFPPLISGLGSPAGMIVSPTSIQKLGPDLVTHPVGTGPFILKSFTTGGEYILVKNPDYWRKDLPYLDGITYVEIPDDRVRAAALQSGQIDVAAFSSAGDTTATLKKDPNLLVSESPGTYQHVSINHALAPMDNLKIRQAVAHCIDRDAIVKVVFQGQATAAKGGMVSPSNWAYADVSDVMYKFDIDKARQLISEAGLKPPVPIKLITSDSSAARKPIGELLKGWLDEAGFQTTFELYAAAELRRRMWDEPTTYHLAISSGMVSTDPDSYLKSWYALNGTYDAGRSSKDPAQLQIEDLLKKGGTAYDQQERKKYYGDAQRIASQSVISVIMLAYTLTSLAIRPSVVGGTDNIWTNAGANSLTRFLWKK